MKKRFILAEIIFLLASLQTSFVFPMAEQPLVRIISPADGEEVWGSIKITAQTSNDQETDEVRFYIDGQRAGYCSTPPYERMMDTNLYFPGPHRIQVKVIDKSGRVSESEIISIIITGDTVPPITTSDYSYNLTWVNKDANIKLTARDDRSGVAATYYIVNDYPAQAGDTITILSEGTHILQYWSEDNSGNIEPKNFITLKIDKTPPVTNAVLSEKPNENGWITKLPVEVTFSAVDNLSGVKYTTPGCNINLESINKVAYYSEDIAGNIETGKIIIIKTDISPPVISLTPEPCYLWPVRHKPIKVNVYGQTLDNLSGIAAKKFTVIDEYNEPQPTLTDFGQSVKLVPWRPDDDMDGRRYTIKVVVTDTAGNASTMEEAVIVPHDIKEIEKQQEEEKKEKEKAIQAAQEKTEENGKAEESAEGETEKEGGEKTEERAGKQEVEKVLERIEEIEEKSEEDTEDQAVEIERQIEGSKKERETEAEKDKSEEQENRFHDNFK